jgi:GT2 family glycosyltransferase
MAFKQYSHLDVAIPTLSKFDLLEKCVQSIMEGSFVPTNIWIMDNSGGAFAQETWPDNYPSLRIIRPPSNVGVAASWNYFLTYTSKEVVICNDDIEFMYNTLEQFVLGTELHPEGGIFYCDDKYQGSEYSCFVVKKWVTEEIGLFDEQFFPAYFEDNDFNHRAKVAGVPIIRLPALRFGHVGSATLKGYSPAQLERHHQEFRANRSRYERKWGGLPGEEAFTTPYNGDGYQRPVSIWHGYDIHTEEQ